MSPAMTRCKPANSKFDLHNSVFEAWPIVSCVDLSFQNLTCTMVPSTPYLWSPVATQGRAAISKSDLHIGAFGTLHRVACGDPRSICQFKILPAQWRIRSLTHDSLRRPKVNLSFQNPTCRVAPSARSSRSPAATQGRPANSKPDLRRGAFGALQMVACGDSRSSCLRKDAFGAKIHGRLRRPKVDLRAESRPAPPFTPKI